MSDTTTSLLSHLAKMSQHPSVPPGTLRVQVTLQTGHKLLGNLHAVFDGGIALLNDNRLIYVPLSGMGSAEIDHPEMAA